MLKIGDKVRDRDSHYQQYLGKVIGTEPILLFGIKWIKIGESYAIWWEDGFCGWYYEKNVEKIS